MSKTLTRYGYPHGKRDLSETDRFWEKVNKGEGCWEWSAALSTDGGCGMFRLSGQRRTVKAHRLSWELHFGKIPDGQCVCHKCDNPKCVRPDHLFLGGYLENNRDMVSKGRHGMAIFKPQSVTKLRALYLRHHDRLTHRRVAKWFGVSKATISHILNARNWRQIP